MITIYTTYKTVLSSNYWHFGGNWLLLSTKSALMKRLQKIWAGPSSPPPLIWTKSKRTAFFSQDTFHEFRERICAFVFSLPFHRFGQKNWLKHNMWHFLHLFVYNKTNNDILKITSRSYCSWKITEYSISWKLSFEPSVMNFTFCHLLIN